MNTRSHTFAKFRMHDVDIDIKTNEVNRSSILLQYV